MSIWNILKWEKALESISFKTLNNALKHSPFLSLKRDVFDELFNFDGKQKTDEHIVCSTCPVQCLTSKHLTKCYTWQHFVSNNVEYQNNTVCMEEIPNAHPSDN